MLVFAIAIQNINESYGEVKAYRGRIAVAMLQPKSAVFTPDHETADGTMSDDIDTFDDGHQHTRISAKSIDNNHNNTNATTVINSNNKRDMRNLFCLPSIHTREVVGDSAVGQPQQMDYNEFVIEALLKCHAINYDRDLEPILNVREWTVDDS